MMFKYKKVSYEVNDFEDELYYVSMMHHFGTVYSPFEVCPEIDFPNKDKLGGVVLKFIGGGAAYFKVQREMPSENEVKMVHEVARFLQKNYGEYVVVRIICEPHIEIRDINLKDFDDIDVVYISSRKNDGENVVEQFISKLENDEEFSTQNFILAFDLPFMSRRDDEKFQLLYCKFIKLLDEKQIDLPSVSDVLQTKIYFNLFMSDDYSFIH